MSCVVRRIAARGRRLVEPVEPAPADLAAAAAGERAGGVYAAFGTWHDVRVIRLGDHFDRLEDSAARLGFDLSLDRDLVRRELCEVLREAGLRSARLRLAAHPDDRTASGDPVLTLTAEPFAGPSPEVRAHGVSCRTAPHAARANPRAKQTSWLADRAHLGDGDARPTSPGAARVHHAPYEWLLLDDEERILEGASSNFYAVFPGAGATGQGPASGAATGPGAAPRGGGAFELRTAGEGILPGIARSIVLEVAPGVATLRLVAPRVAELSEAREAFLTSSSRGVVPVVRIDARSVGSGEPGPVTREIARRYDARAAELEEPLCADD
ncbi:MAG: aminotransferase class IV [bacterium]